MYVVAGYSTGSIIKQQKDRRDYIDDFYSTHAPSTGTMADASVEVQQSTDSGVNGTVNGAKPGSAAAANLRKRQYTSQRAHSLPDVLTSRTAAAAYAGVAVENEAAAAAGGGGHRRPSGHQPRYLRGNLVRTSSHNSSRKNYHVRY